MTIPKKLRQIDQTLIKLLGERISILATSWVPPMQDQIASYKPLLLETGVPESAWINIITSCMAALVSSPSSWHKEVEPRNITVVGGCGAMGSFFTERLAAAGHNVRVLEYNDWDRADLLLGTANLVLVSVPLKSTPAVIRRVAQYIPSNAILADIASTKVSIVQTMMETHPGPVVGLHPMFGPGVKSFLSQKIVVCPGRYPDAFQWFLDLLEADGGKLVICTPEEHDRMMVFVQAIRFFSNFSLAAFLAEEEINIERSLEFASPLYRTEINTISRLVAQDAELYVDIMIASKDRSDAINRFAKTYERLATLIAQGDRTALIAEFEATREKFRGETARSLKESNYLINTLSDFLAANELELVPQVD